MTSRSLLICCLAAVTIAGILILGRGVSADAPAQKSFQKWEYKVLDGDAMFKLGSEGKEDALRNALTKLGDEGWELVSVVSPGGPRWFYFKRPK